jgi:hypothetical protein
MVDLNQPESVESTLEGVHMNSQQATVGQIHRFTPSIAIKGNGLKVFQTPVCSYDEYKGKLPQMLSKLEEQKRKNEELKQQQQQQQAQAQQDAESDEHAGEQPTGTASERVVVPGVRNIALKFYPYSDDPTIVETCLHLHTRLALIYFKYLQRNTRTPVSFQSLKDEVFGAIFDYELTRIETPSGDVHHNVRYSELESLFKEPQNAEPEVAEQYQKELQKVKDDLHNKLFSTSETGDQKRKDYVKDPNAGINRVFIKANLVWNHYYDDELMDVKDFDNFDTRITFETPQYESYYKPVYDGHGNFSYSRVFMPADLYPNSEFRGEIVIPSISQKSAANPVQNSNCKSLLKRVVIQKLGDPPEDNTLSGKPNVQKDEIPDEVLNQFKPKQRAGGNSSSPPSKRDADQTTDAKDTPTKKPKLSDDIDNDEHVAFKYAQHGNNNNQEDKDQQETEEAKEETETNRNTTNAPDDDINNYDGPSDDKGDEMALSDEAMQGLCSTQEQEVA